MIAIAPRAVALAMFCAFADRGIAADWLQFGYDARHSGNNVVESAINADNVASLVRLYSSDVPVGVSLVYLSNVTIGGTVRNVLFSTTHAGELAAYDAATGNVIWLKQTPSASPGGGTQSTPVIDPDRQFVYSYGADGKVHKFAVVDGAETTTHGWPQVATVKPNVEHGASALTIASTHLGKHYLYVVNNGYNGDGGDYQGHLTTIDLETGTQRVFNANCSDLSIHFLWNGQPGVTDCATLRSGIWGRPGAVYDTDTDRVYVTTGNGTFDASFGGQNWGDSVLSLAADGSGSTLGRPLDSYTPTDYAALDGYDIDLGSGSLAILPVPPTSTIPHLGMQMGKDSVVRLLNLDDMSGQGGPGFVGGELQLAGSYFATDAPTPHAATWTDPVDGSAGVFIPTSGITAMQLAIDGQGTPSLVPRWSFNLSNGYFGFASPIVANGVLYAPQAYGDIVALDARGGEVLWSAPTVGTSRWGGAIVVDGRLFVAGSTLQAFALDAIFRNSFD